MARGRADPPIGEEPARGNGADHGSDAAAGAGGSQWLGDEPKAEFGEDMLATRFTELHGEDWRYVDAWGKWMLWTYSRWILEGTRAALHLVRLVCRGASNSAATLAWQLSWLPAVPLAESRSWRDRTGATR
jgi:hypothetical protein